jgi:hypothetical protein
VKGKRYKASDARKGERLALPLACVDIFHYPMELLPGEVKSDEFNSFLCAKNSSGESV